jgi:hypothetical protein
MGQDRALQGEGLHRGMAGGLSGGNGVRLLFDAFSSREPVSTSLENA